MKNEMINEKKSPVLPIVVTVGALIWIFSPLDPIPDVMLGLGQLDDLAVFIATVAIDVKFAIEAVNSARNSISSSNPSAYANAGDCVDAEFVEV